MTDPKPPAARPAGAPKRRLARALAVAAALGLAPGAAVAEESGRGASGALALALWPMPQTLLPYLSATRATREAGALVLEPLARFDAAGAVVPVLAEAIPSRENGGISADGRRVVWRLRPGVLWSDGTPFTAADVAFTWAFCTAPGMGCAAAQRFEGVETVRALDPLTVEIRLTRPQARPLGAFVGAAAPILQAAQFAPCLGRPAADCAAQIEAPVGTGPFVVEAFSPGDRLDLGANPAFRRPEAPAFAQVVVAGGGGPEVSARAVLETGEFDYAWNLALPEAVLTDYAQSAIGTVERVPSGLVARVVLNLSDPGEDLPEGLRATAAAPNPRLADPAVRRALDRAIDRGGLAEEIWGAAGAPACALFVTEGAPPCPAQDPEAARAGLAAAGWALAADGVRRKGARRLALRLLAPDLPQDRAMAERIAADWRAVGAAVEVVTVAPAAFFSPDPRETTSLHRFWADAAVYSDEPPGPDPQAQLADYLCDARPAPETLWQGADLARFCDPIYDGLWAELAASADPARRARLAASLEARLTREAHVVLPLVARARVSARARSLIRGPIPGWDAELADVADWRRGP